MNRIYRTLWSAATQSWQAVPETAKTAGKKSKSSAGGVVASVALSLSLSGGAGAQSPPAINQLPTGGTVARGVATISQTATAQAAAMTVNQSSQRAVVNWNTFNLGSAASINFVQPNAQSVTLNRVNDSNPSQIFGRITANGQVFLTNASGVYFSPSSSVDVGAITATTHSITDDNFMSGKYAFDRNGSTGKVVNEGHITAALGGYVALLAPEVQNAGVVVARAGTVTMAAGELITLSVDGAGSLAGITTTPSAIASLVENKLAVLAPDGQIILSAVALDKLQAGVVRNSGSLEANSLVNKGGKIVLEGDDIVMDRNSKIEAKGRTGGGVVLVGGDWQGSGDLRQATKVTMEAGATIDTSATDNGDGGKVVLWSDIHNADSVTRVNGSIKAEAGPNGGDGGQIETSGHVLNVDGIQVSTQSQNSATGMWLLDPWDITIDSSNATGTTWANSYTSAATSTILASSIATALGTGTGGSNVTVTTGGTAGDGNGSGNITVNTDLSWSSNKTLTLTALGGISGTGNISMTGAAGAGLILNQTGNSTYSGNISGTNANFAKQGAGTLTLTGNNSYGGLTTLISGTLNLGSANAIGTSGTINFAGGTLQYSSANNTTDYSSRFSTAASQVFKIDSNGYDLTFAANLGVSGSTLNKSGLGTLTLTGTDTGLTSITIAGGNLQIGDGGTTGALNYAIGLTITTSSGTSLIYNHSDAVNLGTGLTLNGAGGLTKAGAGSLNFTGNSVLRKAWTGNTYVKAGRLIFGNQPMNSTTSNLIIDAGAIFDYSASDTFGSLSGAGTVYTTGGSLLTVGGSNTNTEFSGIFASNGVAGNGPLIAKQGTGTLIISGSSETGFRGYNVNAGVLQIGKGGAGGTSTWELTSFGGGTLAINRSDTTSFGGFYGSGKLQLNGSGTTTITSSSGGFTGTVELNAGVLALGIPYSPGRTSLSTSSGSIVFGGGTLQFGAGDTGDYSSRFSTVANQNYKIDTNGQTVTFATALTSSGGTLTKLGTGTLILSGANTYTGATTVSAGTLQVGGSTNTTAKLSSSTITSNGDLVFYRSGATTLSAVAPNITTIDGTGNVTVMSTGTLNVDKDITLTGANSTIKLYATSGALANATLTSDLILTNTVTTSDTGSIAIFEGSPTAIPATGSTASLNAKMVGAIGTLKYKVYNSTSASVSSLVAGTRNFYYRIKQTPTVNGIAVASKTYDGTTNATISYTSITGLSADEAGQTFTLSFGTSNFIDVNAGTGKSVTLGGNGSLTNSDWNISGLTVTTPTGLTGTISKANLVLTGSKTYDGTSSVSGSQLIATGVHSESFTVSGSGDSTNLLTANVQTNAALNSVTGLTIGTSNGANAGLPSNYNLVTTGSHFTVQPATAILTATKTYDGNTSLTGSQLTITGVTVGGVTQTLTFSGTASLMDANVATANNYISGTGLVLTDGTGLASNYVLPAYNYSAAYNHATVSAKPITVTLAAPTNTYTYDRLTTYETIASGLTAYTTDTSMVGGDSIASLNYAVSSSGIAQAGNFSVTPSLNSLSVGAAHSNYSFTFTPLTVTVAKATLTVSGTTVASKTYSGTNAATLSGGSLVGVISGDTVTLTETGTFASVNAGTGIAVTANDSLGGTSASNYSLTQPTGLTGTINKANATVTATSNTSTYTGLGQSVSGFSVSGLVNNETAAVLTGVSASATGTNAGTYASIPSGTDTNYNLTFVNGALTINKANATVTANGGTVTYTGLAQSVSGFTASGLVPGETTAVLTGVSAGTTGTNAGTYTSVASGSATNYNLTFVDGTLTINKANATVTASSGTTTYTGLAQSISGFTATGLVNGEAATVLTGVSTSGGAGTNAGTYTHTASGTDSNYNLTFVNGALTIGKANATVIAGSGSATYNGAAQSITSFTATGLVNGETTAVLTGVSALGTGTNAGTYTSTASGTDSNYNLSFTNGTFTINKAPLSVSLSSQTKVYDGTNNATMANGSLTLTGFMSGEGATLTQTQGTYNSANVLNATSVTASLAAGNYTANNGTLLSNYVLPTTATGTGSITPARLSATGTKTYDGLIAFDAAGLTVSGVNGETFAATGSGTMSSKNVQTTQALASIAGLSLSGNNGALTSNYLALTTSDTQVSVTPLAVNLSAPAASKTYDSTSLYQVSAADLTALSSHLVGGDRVTAADVAYANKDAGTGKRVSLNSVTINDDNGGNNYTVGKLDVTTGVINKAPLTVSVVSDARFVTQSDAVGFAGVVYNGLVGGETATVLTPGSITRSNASVNGAGQYAGVLQASGWQSGNYNFSYNAGDYTIVGAHTLLVTVPTVSTTYGTAASYTPTAKYLDSNSNSIVTLTPTVTGNALTVSDGAGGQASFAITAANATLSSSGNVQAGGYNLVASNVVKTGNNFQNLVMTGGLTVTPKVLNGNLGVQAISKVYDGSASISNLGLSFNQPLAGVVSGDTVSLVGSGSFDDRHVATNKTVNLSLGLLGTDATNYALVTPSFSTNTGSITQLASVTYTGATNGNWSDFSNWAGGAMPDRSNVAQVVIPTGKTVLYNSDQVGTIGSTLAVDGAIRFTSSNAFTLANTVSGTGDLQQRGNGMLTVSGTNTNFSGNLDIGTYQATLNNAQALGAAGHVVSSGGQLSVASGVTLAALHVDGAVTVDTAIKTTGDQVYNGALTFSSSGTAQSPNFVSDTGDVDFMSTVSAGSGAMTAQRALVVSAPQGSILFNDQVGRIVKNLDFATYISTGLLDTSPYAVTATAPTIKLFGDITTFESQTYDGAVRVGNNTHNGNTRLLVSVDPSITFKGTVDDTDPTGKVNGLDVRAISLAALVANAPVPTITFESNVGSTSPLASLHLAAGIQNTAAGALVTDIKTDDTSRRDAYYKGDIVLKGNLTVDSAPEMIAEQLLVPNSSQTLTWFNGTPDFKLRLPALSNTSNLPGNLQLNGPGSTNGGNGGSSNSNSSNTDSTEAGRQWMMAHDTHEHAKQVQANNAAIKAMDTPTGRLVADVQVGNEASVMPVTASPATNSSHAQAQTVNISSSGAFVQVREFAPQTFSTQQAFVYQLPSDTFVHSRENEYIKLSATLSNGANLPRWVKFSAKTRSFSGEAPKHVKSLDVKVIATDRQGKRASTRVRLVFTNGSTS